MLCFISIKSVSVQLKSNRLKQNYCHFVLDSFGNIIFSLYFYLIYRSKLITDNLTVIQLLLAITHWWLDGFWGRLEADWFFKNLFCFALLSNLPKDRIINFILTHLGWAETFVAWSIINPLTSASYWKVPFRADNK